MKALLKRFGNISAKSIILVLTANMLTGCIELLEHSPIESNEYSLDKMLLGNWLTVDDEFVSIELDGLKYLTTFQVRERKFVSHGVSADIGSLKLFSINVHLSESSLSDESNGAVASGHLLFRYQFMSETKLKVTPLNAEFLGKQILSGAVSGKVNEACSKAVPLWPDDESANHVALSVSSGGPNIFCPILKVESASLLNEILNSPESYFPDESSSIMEKIVP